MGSLVYRQAGGLGLTILFLEILQGLENWSDTQMPSSWNVLDLRERIKLLESILRDKGPYALDDVARL